MSTEPARKTPEALRAQIRHHALNCVMCGICMPHCLTFALTQNEADGPRGRISLTLGLSEGKLAATPDVVAHLDACLTCRACESACPSQVQYGVLIDDVRDALAHHDFAPNAQTDSLQPNAALRGSNWLRDRLLSKRQVFGTIWAALNLADRLRLIGLARRFGGRLGQTLPPVLARRFCLKAAQSHPHAQRTTQTVGLFIGCTGESLNSDVVRASIKVLNALGYAVEIPSGQVCCGAMHQHGGDTAKAALLRAENRRVFSAKDLTAIVVIGTACASELVREASDVPVMEITGFLAELPDEHWPPLLPNPAQVAIHVPCSQVNALKHPHTTERLLSRIPQINLVRLATNNRCCGAAGLHVLTHPEQADALRAPNIDELAQLKPDCVVSANIGCATHIAVGLGSAVRHPVEIVFASMSRPIT